MTRQRWVIAAVALVLILTTTGVGSAYALGIWSSEDNSSDDDTGRAANVAKRFMAADDTPILKINGQTVTYRDYAYELGKAEFTLGTMREAINEGPDQSTLTPQQKETQQEWVQTIERVGIKSVAMGSLIAETATYRWAISEGYTASDDEIAAKIEQQRQTEEDMAGTRAGNMSQAFIDVVGEERYWNEILPREMERQIVLSEANLAVISGKDGTATDAGAWVELTANLVKAAEIEVLDSDKIDPETVEHGRQYIVEDYAELQTQHQSPGQT